MAFFPLTVVIGAVLVRVPRLNDGPSDFGWLFRLQDALNKHDEDVALDFSGCDFIRQNAVAIIGGLAVDLEMRGLVMRAMPETLRSDVRRNLERNGLLEYLGVSCARNAGTAIPFRHDATKDADAIVTYLEQSWLGNGWVNVSQRALDRIVGSVWEIYENAFAHADSAAGVFSCGQYYPNLKRLKLAVADFGVGIPQRVTEFLSPIGAKESLTDSHCMRWAFAKGNSTTRTGASAGVGLDILRELVEVNNGTLEVYSHAGHARVTKHGDTYAGRKGTFAGTVLNMTLVCDDSYYCLTSENRNDEYF
jgi:hypothetical protein